MPAALSADPTSYVNVPLRDTNPTVPGRVIRAGMMPIFATPGVINPGQFGPIKRADG